MLAYKTTLDHQKDVLKVKIGLSSIKISIADNKLKATETGLQFNASSGSQNLASHTTVHLYELLGYIGINILFITSCSNTLRHT